MVCLKSPYSTVPAVTSAAFLCSWLFSKSLCCTSMTLLTLSGLENKRLSENQTGGSPRDTMSYLATNLIIDRLYKGLAVKLWCMQHLLLLVIKVICAYLTSGKDFSDRATSPMVCSLIAMGRDWVACEISDPNNWEGLWDWFARWWLQVMSVGSSGMQYI